MDSLFYHLDNIEHLNSTICVFFSILAVVVIFFMYSISFYIKKRKNLFNNFKVGLKYIKKLRTIILLLGVLLISFIAIDINEMYKNYHIHYDLLEVKRYNKTKNIKKKINLEDNKRNRTIVKLNKLKRSYLIYGFTNKIRFNFLKVRKKYYDRKLSFLYYRYHYYYNNKLSKRVQSISKYYS